MAVCSKCSYVNRLVAVHGMTTYKGSRYTSPFILNLLTIWRWWGIGVTPRLHYFREKAVVPVEYEAAWAPKTVWGILEKGEFSWDLRSCWILRSLEGYFRTKVPKSRYRNNVLRLVGSQNRGDLMYIAAGAWNYARQSQFSLPAFEPRTVQSVVWSLYRVSYPGSWYKRKNLSKQTILLQRLCFLFSQYGGGGLSTNLITSLPNYRASQTTRLGTSSHIPVSSFPLEIMFNTKNFMLSVVQVSGSALFLP
jgi:hypothetical protein